MKTIITSIALVFSFAAAAVILPSSGSRPSCAEPITYRIGTIDQRYDIDEQQLLNIMREVEALWHTALERPLIKYSDRGDVVIKLVYSQNQKNMFEERRLSERISVSKQQIDILKQEYKRLSRSYNRKEKDLKDLLSEQRLKTAAINQKFNHLKKDGISASEKQTIEQKKRDRKLLKYRIHQRYGELESLRTRLNIKLQRINALNEQINEMIENYNQQFALPTEFHQGKYIKKGKEQYIVIYQFNNRNELKMVLAHEIGHALGLKHIENPESVMYYMMEKQNIIDLALTKEDIKALKSLCMK